MEVTASFNTNGSLNGSGGCNTFNGGFQAYDQALLISSLTSSTAACEEAVMQQEADFFTAMKRSASMSIFGSELSVRDASGKTILTLTRG